MFLSTRAVVTRPGDGTDAPPPTCRGAERDKAGRNRDRAARWRRGRWQARSIAAELAGDQEAAARVELVLDETGVCGGAGLFDADSSAAETAAGSGCCGSTGSTGSTEPVSIGAAGAGA